MISFRVYLRVISIRKNNKQIATFFFRIEGQNNISVLMLDINKYVA